MAYLERRYLLQQSCECLFLSFMGGSHNILRLIRAQTWHDPADVERALDVSLRDLQLDYGTTSP